MTICPNCRRRNIEGSDECASCGQSLTETYLSPPSNEVERSLLGDRIEVLLPKTPITVKAETPVGEVMRLMVDKQIGCVVIVDGSKPVGIFSERDALLRVGTQSAALAGSPVAGFMTPTPETLVADAKLAFAVQRMDLGGYRHLPIVDTAGDLVGIISARDVIRHLTELLARG